MEGALESTSFISRRVNATTYLIIEDDRYGEQPYIYVKVYHKHLLITDTGCNSSRVKERTLTSLRQYLETFPLPSNNNKILNPGGEKQYVILCSHCHYDHILGIPQFLDANPCVIASDFNKTFLLEDLPRHSLCKYVDQATPRYTISHWASHLGVFNLAGVSFRVQFLHVPGHTPDSLAWYDNDEHHIYVGDTFYERKRSVKIPGLPDDAGQVPGLPATQAAIIFPEEGGNWVQYMASIEMLLSFVQHQNKKLIRERSSNSESSLRVKVACGHLTHDADAEEMIGEVQSLFKRIIAGKVPVRGSGEKRGVIHDFWLEGEDARYSVMAPRHLAEEARDYFKNEGKFSQSSSERRMLLGAPTS